MSLRETLGIQKESEAEWKAHIQHIVKPNTIVYITDEFFCQYVTILLPETENALFSIGPYITNAITIEQLLEIMEQKNVPQQWLPILKSYYQRIPCLANEEGLVAGLNAFADCIWGKDNYSSESFIQGLPNSLEPIAVPTDPQKRVDAFSNIEAIEQVYKAEKELLKAVSNGRSARAKTLLANFPLFALEQRTEATRNLQNYTIVINTLLRKAAEEGGVHPLYIDQLSSTFAHRIESATRSDNFVDLWNEMIQKYCALVNRHSVKHYSLPIQKVITRIDFDLAADLSLKATAQYLNVNASYLSNLFKTETGYTLTDYVNMKRMDHAAYLLANTHMSVSAIAQSCGILDDNYFTKLFKRYHHKTPTKFRQDHYTVRKV
ncbi:MAG: helix-turn-helix transcriptional regulator [Agathobacter sp.]|nr:helix-turn-helix transcriptional regulator [Agathobacter sp.]